MILFSIFSSPIVFPFSQNARPLRVRVEARVLQVRHGTVRGHLSATTQQRDRTAAVAANEQAREEVLRRAPACAISLLASRLAGKLILHLGAADLRKLPSPAADDRQLRDVLLRPFRLGPLRVAPFTGGRVLEPAAPVKSRTAPPAPRPQ